MENVQQPRERIWGLKEYGKVDRKRIWGFKEKGKTPNHYSDQDDIGKYTTGPTGARTIRKGFQTHSKKSRLVRNSVLNLSRINSNKKKKKKKSQEGVVSNWAVPSSGGD